MMMPRIRPKRRYSFVIDSFLGGVDQRYDQQVLPPYAGAEVYNVSTDEGVLKPCGGYGRKSKYNPYGNGSFLLPKVPDGIKRIHVNKVMGKDVLMLEGEDGWYEEWYGLSETVFKKSAGYGSNIKVWIDYSVGQRSMKIISGPSAGCQFITSDGGKIYQYPGFSHGTIYAERLFGVGDWYYPNRIYFSAQYDPSDLEEGAEHGGYIDVNSAYGKAVGMAELGSSLYIFWQHGITELRGYGYQSEFVLRDCYRCSQFIFDTAEQCGDRLIFAAEDGVYSFDGERVRCISKRIRDIYGGAEKSEAVSVFWRNAYYVAVHSDNYGGEGNNVVLRYNCELEKWDILVGIGIKCMVRVDDLGKDELLFLADDGYIYGFDGSDRFGDKPINAVWESPMSTLGKPDMIKQIRCIMISAEGEGSLEISVESERGKLKKSLTLSKERRMYSVPMRISGHMIRLGIRNREGSRFTVAEPVIIFTAG